MNKVTILAFFIISTFACRTSNVQQMFNDLQDMQPPDYSQIREPRLSEPKAQIENILMELYDADTVVMTSTGMFKYGADSTVLTSQWFKVTFLNSKRITDAKNGELSNNLAREIGTYLKPKILNPEDYAKIEIIFINEVESGSIKHRINLSIPNLEFLN